MADGDAAVVVGIGGVAFLVDGGDGAESPVGREAAGAEHSCEQLRQHWRKAVAASFDERRFQRPKAGTAGAELLQGGSHVVTGDVAVQGGVGGGLAVGGWRWLGGRRGGAAAAAAAGLEGAFGEAGKVPPQCCGINGCVAVPLPPLPEEFGRVVALHLQQGCAALSLPCCRLAPPKPGVAVGEFAQRLLCQVAGLAAEHAVQRLLPYLLPGCLALCVKPGLVPFA